MTAAFWEIAGPLTSLNANDIYRGDEKRLKIFQAAAMKIGHPVYDPGCLICIKESLTHLKNEFKQFEAMAKKTKASQYIIKGNNSIAFKGVRYNQENITDAVAVEMLSEFPEYKKFFSFIHGEFEPVKKEEKPKPKAKKATPKKKAKPEKQVVIPVEIVSNEG